jgi:hypothetical protein
LIHRAARRRRTGYGLFQGSPKWTGLPRWKSCTRRRLPKRCITGRRSGRRRNRRNGEVMRDVVKRALLNPDHSIIFSFSVYGGADSDIVTSARLPRPMRSPSSPRPRSGSGTLPVHYSMTRSARPRIVGEIVIPRALAVLRFTASSIFVGNSTGRSLGLVPCRILSTKFDIR